LAVESIKHEIETVNNNLTQGINMKIRNILFAFIILLAFNSLPVMALGQGYNAGIGLGSSSFQLNESGLISNFSSVTSASSFSDSSTTLTVFAGIQLDEYLSIDMDFLILGDITSTQGGVKTKLFDVSSLAMTVGLSHALSESITGFGRIGIHMWDVSESSDNFSSIDTAVDLTYGLGLDINLYGDKSRQLRIQWNRYQYDGVYIDTSDTFTMSLLFLFGDS
jgi:hypothetical protein